MLSLAAIVLFSFAAVVALGALTLQVMATLPKLAELRRAECEAPAMSQVRFSISEVVVSTDGKVVALPVKQARLAIAVKQGRPARPLIAAA